MLTHLTLLYDRDLTLLANEVNLYPTGESLWIVADGIANSGGNLVLHLCGNLRHYIGFRLGAIDYRRDRPAEFSLRGLSKAELLAKIESARHAVATALVALPASRLDELYPEEVMGAPMAVGFFLIHINGHLRYHTGQINYHRRLLGNQMNLS